MKRASGVLMHISTLFGDFKTGSFGDNAKEFIDFLHDMKFSYWQVLPFLMPDGYNSPYQSPSAFSLNPYFIDVKILFDKGYIDSSDLENAKQKIPYACEFESLKEERYKLLLKASKNSDKNKVLKFAKENPYIDEFCHFMALKEANDNLPHNLWKSFNEDPETLFMWQFTQYEFINQWAEIKDYANSKGIKIIGDIPIYVSYDSSDLYFHKNYFDLNKDNLPNSVAGVPPDYFSEDGQLWGNPLYNWDEMEKDNFKWWKDRLSHMLNLFDGVRIDHFRGLESYWSIPYGAKTAKEGHWEKAKGKKFIDEIKKITKDKLIIAEDLGEISREVYDLVNYSGFPGMRVMQFGFLDDSDSIHKCHNYINNSVAYTGTHDNNTLLGYVWSLDDDKRKTLLNYCGYFDENWDKCYDSIIRTLFASSAGLVILPIQDLLLFGEDTRINIPGRTKGNWSFRITKEQLYSIDKEKYRKLNELYLR